MPAKKNHKKKAAKKSAKKKSAKRKPARKKAGRRATSTRKVQSRSRRRPARTSARPSSDLQGLSRAEQADSESVSELVDEGNVYEAGAVAGVEEADRREGKEVRTREFAEDDVPQEYLDKD